MILDWNKLSGPIPPEIGGLAALKDLSLSNNALTGPIPPEIGNLAGLEVLDLHSNGLSGSIPLEMASLAALTQLYLMPGNPGLCSPNSPPFRAWLAALKEVTAPRPCAAGG